MHRNIILGYFSLQRFLVAIMGPLMFLSGMFLALRAIPSTNQIVVGFIAVYLLTATEHTIDDFIDIERDKIQKIIVNNRKLELVTKMRRDLLGAARGKNEIQIYH